MSVEEIKQTLSTNQNITEEVKSNIIEITQIILNNLPTIKLDNFNERLKTLVIEESNKYVHPGIAEYNPLTNILRISKPDLEQGDAKHILTHQLLNVITAKDDYTGFANDKNFKALNRGFTEIIANNLVGNDSDVSYYDEEVNAASMTALLIGHEAMMNAYFINDSKVILNEIIAMGGNV